MSAHSSSLTRPQVAVYYFPNYHLDARNRVVHGEGWTEWDLVRDARPRYPGHRQPRVPAWGYEDEADPITMARKIDAAADHGIDAFIFDWYWYDDGPFIERALDEGFLKAANNHRLKFALMWANHDWLDIHPATAGVKPALLYPGKVAPATFDYIIDLVVDRYFQHPSHWKIDGRPYFSVYELFRFIESLGGADGVRRAVDHFRNRAVRAGLPGVHLNAVVWGVRVLPGEKTLDNPGHTALSLGFDSVTSYVWVHHVKLADFPETDYVKAMDGMRQVWADIASKWPLPYHPNVTMGWDASPRTAQDGPFGNFGYPFCAGLAGNTPERFGEAMRHAIAHLDRFAASPADRVITVNAWNEWTEGSYLEPDTVHGMAYLEAIRDAVGVER